MEQFLKVLSLRKERLCSSKLCTFVGSEPNASLHVKLSFAPAMLFFTMGFKDILNSLKEEDSSNPLQLSVNIHCEEDSEHWRWFLSDLNKLPAGNRLFSKSATELVSEIWSDKYHVVRSLVYNCIHLSKIYDTAFYRLVMIESLEATFDCFNNAVFELVKSFNMEDYFEYFGQAHAHSEANHAMEKSNDEHESSAFAGYHATAKELEVAVTIVNAVFDEFDVAFNCWFDHIMVDEA
jgi:hypothetical protein